MLKNLLFLVCLSILMTGAAIAQDTEAAKPAPAAATTGETAKPARFTPTKDQVMQGQTFLKQASLYNGDATGVYNDDTRAAIRTWQKSNGIPVSGNFNRATLEKMGIPLTDKQKGVTPAASASSDKSAKSTPTAKTTAVKAVSSGDATGGAAKADGPKRPAPFQATADQIKQLQQKLIEAKLFAGEADGNRSDALKVSVLKYQKENGLKTTGGINAETLTKAGVALTDKQKQQEMSRSNADGAKGASRQD
jgi:peptidoglycan hydrolase-like protein with peptidoglycan-binding domain